MQNKAALVLTGALLASSTSAETVHGAVIYSRHGDRTTKHYGAQALTSLGAQQNFQVGSSYRSRYLTAGSPQRIAGISEFAYVPSQVYASAPNQGILLNTATSFLQGLYPPLGTTKPDIASQTLNNGSAATNPLNGYQYVQLASEKSNSPDTIWIKGDDGCPAITAASESFEQSQQFRDTVASTRDFYRSFYPVLNTVYDIKSADDLSFAKAYDIFDLVNVARIHNGTNHPAFTNVTEEQLSQLRTLSDTAEWGYNFNASQPARQLHAQTLAAGLLAQLNQTVTSKGKLKLSLLAGSYDTFMAFHGLLGLPQVNPDFYGLPEYASTLAMELFTTTDNDAAFPANPAQDLRVRFLFKNGTAGTLSQFPIFGSGKQDLSWPEFLEAMKSRAITSVGQWCSLCSSKATFCAAYKDTNAAGAGGSQAGEAQAAPNGISNTVAGVIGAMVTLGVVALLGGLAFVVLRRRRASRARAAVAPAAVAGEKTSVRSGSDAGKSV